MSRLVLYMAMSLDGFITGPEDDKENPAGRGGMRLMEWLGAGGPEVADWTPSDPRSWIVFDEMMATGAVVTGRRTGDFADYWGGDHQAGSCSTGSDRSTSSSTCSGSSTHPT